MSNVVRIGDIHIGVCNHGAPCCPHQVTGVYAAGAAAVVAHGPAVVRIGDALIHNCPHCGVGIAATGSDHTRAEGSPIHRLGDAVTYPGGAGVAMTGDPKFTTL